MRRQLEAENANSSAIRRRFKVTAVQTFKSDFFGMFVRVVESS
jgi:hypothetical protein